MFLLCLLPSLLGCDKVDDNGDFGGYWLFEEVVSTNSATDAGPRPQSLSWGVRCEVIQIRRLLKTSDNEPYVYYFLSFVRSEDILQLTAAFGSDGSHDTPIPFSELPKDFAIPDDGRLKILRLSASSLLIEGRDNTVMRFKKH